MRGIFLIIVFLQIEYYCFAQEKVTFFAADSLKITADLYLKDYNLPFILLFHQDDASRGEFKEIANRLLNLNYNCLAVDLRVGDKINYIQNETAERAKSKGQPQNFIDVEKDIDAAIKFVSKFNRKPVILFGSSFSASLCLVVAKDNNQIKAVIGFSPGEYFRPELVVKDKIAGLKIPVFISSTELEYEYILHLMTGVSDEYKTIFKPKSSKGVHGAKTLWKLSESSDECWLELLLFFKKIKD
jgi:pimeloyl-ACP methyl ester carboxylesterase